MNENAVQNVTMSEVSSAPMGLDLALYGHPALRQMSQPIAEITPEIRDLAARMIVTMLTNETAGIGLAAPQVGVNLRLITLATESSAAADDASAGELLLGPKMPLALVNPEIVSFATATSLYTEGCLSVPDVYEEVARPVSVVLRGLSLDGQPFQVACGGLLARCLQHEIDHLDGVLFVDRLNAAATDAHAAKLKKLEKRVTKALQRQCR